MMERNFYNDEFEQLIREKTDQYKMYPSENVWKGIHGSLHTKRRWFIGTMSVLIVGVLLFAGKELILPGNHSVISRKIAANTAPSSKVAETPEDKALEEAKPEDKEKNLTAALSDFKTGSSRSLRNSHQTAGRYDDKTRGPVSLFDETSNDEVADGSNTAVVQAGFAAGPSGVEQAGLQTGAQIASPAGNLQTGNLQAGSPAASKSGFAAKSHSAARDNGDKEEDAGDKNTYSKDIATRGSMASSLKAGPFSKKPGSGKASATHLFTSVYYPYGQGVNTDLSSDDVLAGLGLPRLPRPTLHLLAISIDKKQTEKGLPMIPAAPAIDVVETGKSEDNWLEEYAINELVPTKKQHNRFSLQLYITPGVSYRSLSVVNGNSVKTNMQNQPLSPSPTAKPGLLANQKPSPGFEAGGSLLYRLNHRLTLKAGLQFNYVRYTLTNSTATASATPNPAATGSYAPTMDPANQGAGIHSTTKASPLLTNQYFQLAAPIGLELRILGGDRLQLNLAASIQPTYLFNTNSYVPATDLSGYTGNASAFRRWNFNGAVEAFLSYKIGSLRWQIGPEFRYQLLSTYSSQYPIRENFRQYGLKIGVSKTIW